MKLRKFIQNDILLPRLRETGVLVVYDPERRYRDLCRELASPSVQVVDASESSIESREAALAALQELGRTNASLEGLLVYVPAPRPLTDEQKQVDPFALYGACGKAFPASDGDEFLSLCLRAKADHATEIRRIFQDNPNPDFAMIDAVGSGQSYAQLSTLLGVESAREIIFALLAPTDAQQQALKEHDTWVAEAKDLFRNALGLKLMTRAKTWGPIADELWRFLLFSEFAFDLPEPLPAALENVPHAPAEARPLVDDLCDRLRSDARTQPRYIERAESVEQVLNLPALCQDIANLGVRDTFPFEERASFSHAVTALREDDADKLWAILARHRQSVWVARGENESQWQLLKAAADLIHAADDALQQLGEPARSQDSLIDYYLATLCQVDRLHREFEQAANEQIYLNDEDVIGAIMEQARRAYRKLADAVQESFLRRLSQSGWPPPGRLANADVFDKVVAPLLQQSGRRVALLLIDALRYELGVELQKQLAGEHAVELQAAFAALPSVTPVGMASLLPGAGGRLALARRENGVTPMLDEQVLGTVAQRMAVLRRRYGQRFHEMRLLDFVRARAELPEPVELLVVRSNEMDNDFETNPEAALNQIVRTFQQIQAAVHRLRNLGFQDVVIVADHGFYLNTIGGPGEVCPKPPGNWINVHGRLLLGEGASDSANWVMPADVLGMRGDFGQAAGPHAMVAYQAGMMYLHGGASLPETVVPVLSVRLRAATPATTQAPKVTLRYKRGGKRITTRLPVVEVEISAGDLFSMDAGLDILLEAQDRQGNVVGEAQPGGSINPATGTLSAQPGTTVQVTMRMEMDFEGKFTIKALDPATMAQFDKLDLETDYTV